MNSAAIHSQRQRLDNLFQQVSRLTEDEELKAHFAKYLCVLVSGFIEISIRSIYSEYASEKAAPYVENFVRGKLKNFRNPKMGKILELTRSFSPEWEAQLSLATQDDVRSAIDSIVDNRNKIAHGESVGLTYVRIKDYYERAIKLLETLDALCA